MIIRKENRRVGFMASIVVVTILPISIEMGSFSRLPTRDIQLMIVSAYQSSLTNGGVDPMFVFSQVYHAGG